MSKRTFFLAMTAIFLIMVSTQGVCGQNKVKKVKYLGHKYNGEVNQEKIPEGTGIMDYELFTVEGNFDGNNITNPIFKNSQLHFDYNGNASYDDSGNIVLKAGGVMVNYCLIKHNWKTEYSEIKISNTQLTKDSVINTKTMNTKELPVSYEVNINLPQEINPPKIIISDIIKLTEYTYVEQIQGVSHEYKANGFIGNGLLEKSYKIQGYTDDKGRIWDLENTGASTSIKGWDVKVVYPDGSFYKGHIGTGAGNDYSDDLKILYPNGDIIEEHDGRLGLCLNNGLILLKIEKMQLKDFAKLYDSKTYPKFEIYNIHDSKGILSGLPSNKIGEILGENVFQKYTKTTERVNIYDIKGDYIGFYSGGKYATEKEAIATIQEEKKKNAEIAAKEVQAKIQTLSKIYGKTNVEAIFNNKLIVGMPIKLLINDASWVNVYKMHMYNGGESGDFKVEIMVEGKTTNGWTSGSGVYYRTYRVWVKNWKITQFRNWNKADEREFNRL